MFTAFPSIEQYRDVIGNVEHITRYTGKNAYGKATYDHSRELPKLKFKGTVKLHGTNSAIGYDSASGQYWAQSRNGIVTPTKDNVGFAKFAENVEVKNYFTEVLKDLSSKNGDYPIIVYGEFCGTGIQKNVSISQLPKMFVVFGVKVRMVAETGTGEEGEAEVVTANYWLGDDAISLFHKKELNIWNVNQFKTWNVEIDFNNPKASQNTLVSITQEVEKECPVGAYFGVKGVGEGVVWMTDPSDAKYPNLRFKVKGDEHSSSKVTTLAPVDTEKLENIARFVEYAVTENRLNQGIEQVFTVKGTKPNVKQIADFLKWISADVMKEETDTVKSNGLSESDVVKAVSGAARKWFLTNHKIDILVD